MLLHRLMYNSQSNKKNNLQDGTIYPISDLPKKSSRIKKTGCSYSQKKKPTTEHHALTKEIGLRAINKKCSLTKYG